MKIKKPKDISPKRRREEAQVSFLALTVEDQAMLDRLLAGAAPAMKAAMLTRLAPHLRFVPEESAAADCPECGLSEGALISHECLASPQADPPIASAAD